MSRSSAHLALVGGAATLVLAAGSLAAMAAVAGSLGTGYTAGQMTSSTWAGRACTAPTLAGSGVDVKLTDMGSAMHRWASRAGGASAVMPRGPLDPMMGSQWRGRMMQVRLRGHTVPAGTVSLRVSDVGAMDHELLILPLRAGARVGQRSLEANGTVDEHSSLGEVSNNCGAGVGDGLHPGGTGWTTLHLSPGRYELICNWPGHYAAGMFAELDATR